MGETGKEDKPPASLPCPKDKEPAVSTARSVVGSSPGGKFSISFFEAAFFCSSLQSPFEPSCLLSNWSELFPRLPQQRGLFTAQLSAAGNRGWVIC